jgi:hypothetical protein
MPNLLRPSIFHSRRDNRNNSGGGPRPAFMRSTYSSGGNHLCPCFDRFSICCLGDGRPGNVCAHICVARHSARAGPGTAADGLRATEDACRAYRGNDLLLLLITKLMNTANGRRRPCFLFMEENHMKRPDSYRTRTPSGPSPPSDPFDVWLAAVRKLLIEPARDLIDAAKTLCQGKVQPPESRRTDSCRTRSFSRRRNKRP